MDTETPETPEPHEGWANELQAALTRLGVDSNVHWDRSPWGVRIGLVDGTYDDPTYDQPSLFVLIESMEDVAGNDAKRWDLALGNFGEDSILEEMTGTILERPWLGEDVNDVAKVVEQYVFLLRNGATITNTRTAHGIEIDANQERD